MKIHPTLNKALSRAKKKLSESQYKLRPHQEEGVRWLLKKELGANNKNYKGGLLCDDPGLGKTIQTAGLILGNPVENTLIVVPTSVFNQWRDILQLISGENNVYLHTGPKRAHNILELYTILCGRKITLTTYGLIIDSFSDSKTVLHKIKWDRIILDEGHIIRNARTKMHRMACEFQSTYRWILTGTPIQNKKNDIVNLLNFVGIPSNIAKNNLEEFINKYVLRRTKEILFNTTFTDYEIINHQCPFTTKKEQNIYKAIQTDAVKEILESENENKLNLLIIELILRLRQATIHPSIAIKSLYKKFPDEDWDNKLSFNDISTKIQKLREKIKEASGLSLVFCHFHEEMELIKKYLGEYDINSEIYNGSMSIQKREEIINKFKIENTKPKYVFRNGKLKKIPNNGPTVLIIQIKAGGVGLNLQQFKNVFLCSPDWNPSNEIQAIARSHRMGQKENVLVHKFTLVENSEFGDKKLSTIDQRILGIQFKKRVVMSELLKDNTLEFRDTLCNGRNKFSVSDLMSLLTTN